MKNVQLLYRAPYYKTEAGILFLRIHLCDLVHVAIVLHSTWLSSGIERYVMSFQVDQFFFTNQLR